MLMEVENCKECGRKFTFDTKECSQAIIREEESETLIIFFPRCPECKQMNTVEMPWEKYGSIDY